MSVSFISRQLNALKLGQRAVAPRLAPAIAAPVVATAAPHIRITPTPNAVQFTNNLQFPAQLGIPRAFSSNNSDAPRVCRAERGMPPKIYRQLGPGRGLTVEQIATIGSLVAERSEANSIANYDRSQNIREELRREYAVEINDRRKLWIVVGPKGPYWGSKQDDDEGGGTNVASREGSWDDEDEADGGPVPGSSEFEKMSDRQLADMSTIPGWNLVHNPPRRNPRGALVGTVVSDKMQKTVNVAVDRYKLIPKYRKRWRFTKKFMAHDEHEVCNTGDLVMIVPCHKISRHKHFMVREIVRAKGQL